jgi:hypothetical protein
MFSRKISLVFSLIAVVNLFSAFETFTDFDARSRAIANANSAIPVSGSVIVVNPALLASFPLSLISVTAMPRTLGTIDVTSLPPPVLNFAGSVVLPIRTVGTFGLAVNALFVNNDNQVGYNEYQISLGFGKKLFKNFAIGVTAIGQYWSLTSLNSGTTLPGDFSTPVTFNANFGIHYEPYEQVSMGLVAVNFIHMNIVQPGNSFTNADYVSRSAVFGLAYTIKSFVIALDSEFVFDTSQVNLKFGSETFFGGRQFHAGIGLELQGLTRGITPSIGIGVNLGGFVIDYAIAYNFNLGGYGLHVLSLTLAL